MTTVDAMVPDFGSAYNDRRKRRRCGSLNEKLSDSLLCAVKIVHSN